MYRTVKEIIREVLNTDVPESERVFAVVLTRGDVRHMAQDWNLSDDELETIMQRLDDAFEYGADVSVVHGVVREMEQKPLTTVHIVDEICDFVVNQQAVFLGCQYILQGSRHR
ncbi:DUF1380 domain-containing protein [Salmonella enterica]|nr:DUF1380 domain-containing protein [Salmonella enterica]EDU6784845.1 DUF1380 domain-containing protein [Salmonella enterica subsp. enterica serovar Gaminara]EGT2787159.1 DUF1380 domain-containing protein [Salmonella enterica subsp. enterica serovar Carmel]EAO4223926.1 DUF1380 domain-containing protein [Salmonella enterica]EAR9571299.1 DUF1380 domain-containing protein [Salmonella enterica]